MTKDFMVIIRDLVSLSVGTFGLVHSQLTGTVSIPLIVVYAAALGIPGVLTALEMFREPRLDKPEPDEH